MSRLVEQVVNREVARVAAAYAAVSWLFLQIVDVTTSMLQLPAWIGRVSIISLVIGFPIALIIAWMYRLTPEGRIERELDIVISEPAKIGGRKIDFVIIGALSLVVVTLLVERSVESRTSAVLDHPVITEYRKLTESNVMLPPVPSILPLVHDESRVYFTDFTDGDYGIRQVLTAGGEAVRFDVPRLHFAIPTDMTPDGKALLLWGHDDDLWGPDSLWTAPIVGGNLRRVGEGRVGVYSPDGAKIVYFKGNERVFVANADMTEPKQIATLPGRGYAPSFSPDGSRIRLTVFKGSFVTNLWEVPVDGGEPEQILSDRATDSLCCGSWTPDGKYFVFEARQGNRSQIWAIKDVQGAEPFQLTTGALDYIRPTLSDDGRTIFASGWQLRGEVMEFDPEDRTYSKIPGLEDMSVDQVEYSADSQRIAYIKYPEFTLWRKSADADSALQLTIQPLIAASPRWSPDSRSIAFTGWLPGETHRIYTVPADGGELRQISNPESYSWSPTWSPDGERLMFSEGGSGRPTIIDLISGTSRSADVNGKLFSPSWSPDGRYIVGRSGPDLVLHDMRTEETRVFAEGKMFERWYWSEDSQSVFVVDDWILGSKRSVYRINVDDGVTSKVWQVGTEFGVWGSNGRWYGVKPDGKLLMLRNQSIHNIYALEWNPE